MKYERVLITGNFNVLHHGHFRLFKFAKELSKKLVIGVFSDNLAGDSIFVNENDRLNSLKSIELVDEVLLIKSSVQDFIKKIRPDAVIKGKEYESKFNIEEEVIHSIGSKLIFSSGSFDYSEDFIKNISSKKYDFPEDFIQRYSINKTNLYNSLDLLNTINLCVIGDIIVDEYNNCKPVGLSQEDSSVVVTITDKVMQIGGAGIVASHGASLGATVDFYSITGKDKLNRFTTSILKKNAVNSTIIIDDERPTTLKQKYLAGLNTMFKVNRFVNTDIDIKFQRKLYESIKKNIKKYDYLIFSDFNYGCLPVTLVKKIIDLCKKNNVLMSADSQSSSQIGNLAKFIGVDFVFCTENEARLTVSDFDNGIVTILEKLHKLIKTKNIFLKLGAEGLIISSRVGRKFRTEKLTAFNKSPINVSGAGDSMLIATSLFYFFSKNLYESAFIGSIAAAIQISRIGNIPIKISELKAGINQTNYFD